jgi:hypothetical protein
MSKTRRFTETIVDYIDTRIDQEQRISKLHFGGVAGSGGGAGGPLTKPIGKLPQTYVTYDLSEEAVITTSGDPSLLDNLNHIRYDVENHSHWGEILAMVISLG